jgi:hypothetical protein
MSFFQSRSAIVATCLLGSLVVYCAQSATEGGDPTPPAKAECDIKPKEFVKLAEGSFDGRAASVSEPVEVKGYAEVVVAVKRPTAGTNATTAVAEFALSADGFFGATGQSVVGGGTASATTTTPRNSGGTRLRVDGNFLRLSVDATSTPPTGTFSYEVWGVK